MKTIEQLMDQFAGKGILEAMAELFRTNDEAFREDEERYLAAVAHLRQEAPADISPSIDEYLAANEKDLITRIVYYSAILLALMTSTICVQYFCTQPVMKLSGYSSRGVLTS